MKIRQKGKLSEPVVLHPKDTVTLKTVEPNGREKTIAKAEIERDITINGYAIFNVEQGEFGEEVKDGIGGAFLSISEA